MINQIDKSWKRPVDNNFKKHLTDLKKMKLMIVSKKWRHTGPPLVNF